MLRRKRKSALSHAESATRIASRAGSWTRRLSDCRYSNGVDMFGPRFPGDIVPAAHRLHQDAMVEEPDDRQRGRGGPDEPPLPVLELRDGGEGVEGGAEGRPHQDQEQPVRAIRPVAPGDAQRVEREE